MDLHPRRSFVRIGELEYRTVREADPYKGLPHHFFVVRISIPPPGERIRWDDVGIVLYEGKRKIVLEIATSPSAPQNDRAGFIRVRGRKKHAVACTACFLHGL